VAIPWNCSTKEGVIGSEVLLYSRPFFINHRLFTFSILSMPHESLSENDHCAPWAVLSRVSSGQSARFSKTQSPNPKARGDLFFLGA
jgi:hypothetical protein